MYHSIDTPCDPNLRQFRRKYHLFLVPFLFLPQVPECLYVCLELQLIHRSRSDRCERSRRLSYHKSRDYAPNPQYGHGSCIFDVTRQPLWSRKMRKPTNALSLDRFPGFLMLREARMAGQSYQMFDYLRMVPLPRRRSRVLDPISTPLPRSASSNVSCYLSLLDILPSITILIL